MTGRLQGLMEIVDSTEDKCPAPIMNADKVTNLSKINEWNCWRLRLSLH